MVSCAWPCRPATKILPSFWIKRRGVDVTESTIFSSKVQLETFIAGTYRIGMHSIFTYNDANLIPTARTYCINAPITDEAEAEVTFFHTEQWNAGNSYLSSYLSGAGGLPLFHSLDGH